MLCLLYVLHLTAYAFEVTTNAQRAQNKYGAEGKQLMKANRLSAPSKRTSQIEREQSEILTQREI